MNREPLTNSVSVQELLEMRESGMTNQQIAERLDVGCSTICRYIGRNPKRAKKVNFKPEKVSKTPHLLKTVEETIKLQGKQNSYTVYKSGGSVFLDDLDIEYSKDDLEVFISELLEVLAMIKGEDDGQTAEQQ